MVPLPNCFSIWASAACKALALSLLRGLGLTAVYPQGAPTFTDALCGRIPEVVVRAQLRSIPPQALPANGEPAPRAPVQAWINELWQAKDEEITQILASKKVTGA